MIKKAGKDSKMKKVIGIDGGGTTTKIVGFTEGGELIEPMFVKADDPTTSVYGAFGKFTEQNGIALCDISRVMITGAGSSFIKQSIYGLECRRVGEFESVARGGMYLSGLDEAIVVSMGTGTAIVHAKKDGSFEYLGGTGVGGGTMMGLSKKLLDMEDVDNIIECAKDGDLDKIDLRLKDISKKEIIPGMPDYFTAANFGKIDDLATKSDLALGIINMVFETVGMLSVFGARNYRIRDIVLTGNMTTIPQAREVFPLLDKMFDMNFIIPELSQFATVIGAALQ